ncbi:MULTISPECIES: ferredoxin [Moorena]|uniref:Ferredoxin n=1 Tax=Moorena producens 3L TaxID=489825 RepID=F4XXF3_9CYAN|nr:MULTISPECIES: ferredoxin [Moorena]NEQ14932.1 ferredoxin [Moorena sp. SIO3E2]EGJ30631.1 ferredoxin [Moorena producens 3L]NEP64582.1 ferredoxin [Moorena sp. SIO3A5]NEQ10985.1 ferredoxin [Moorena sp. SIO4E2]NES42448.1 ferredoxin [Moorena sp. SIO2C4]
MSEFSPTPESERSGLEPELGGVFRDAPERSGFEPELGGILRQKGVYVDEITCIGCKHCAHVARNTFYMEADYGRSRVFRQDGDPEEVIQEAIDTCPVDCIHWVDYTKLKNLEDERQYQVIPRAGLPIDRSIVAAKIKERKLARKRRKKRT